MKCGKTIDSQEREYCKDCQEIPKSYKRGYPLFFYEDCVKKAIYSFKYQNQRNLGPFFARCILDKYKKQLRSLDLDGIVPVPVHPHKRRQRGYNQAEVLAKALAKELQVPMYPYYIRRNIDTNPQKELTDKERMKNLKNAFKIGKNRIKLEKVLVVDDIYTSGATIEACTKVLQEANVKDVYYVSIAIGKGYSQ